MSRQYLENAVRRNLESEREFAEYAMSKAHLLDSVDRQIVLMRYDKGMTYEEVAVRVGMSKGGLTTRAHRIEERLVSETFKLVAMNISVFPKKYRKFATAKYLQGLTLRQIGRKLRMPLHKVREADVATRAILEAMFNCEVKP